MPSLTNPLLIAPKKATPAKYGTPEWDDPNFTSINEPGRHVPLCGMKDEKSVKLHTGLCRSSMSFFDTFLDPAGGKHEVVIERISQYTRGMYDAAEYREKNTSTTFIRFGIDMSPDYQKDATEGLVLSSGDARQIAAILIAEADRADNILPNT